MRPVPPPRFPSLRCFPFGEAKKRSISTKAAFGAEGLFQIENSSGEVVAQLSVSGAAFWVADESPEHSNFSPESLGGSSVRIIMVVEDPDRAFARAVAAGAKPVSPVNDQHGWRVGRVADPYGHHWQIGRPLPLAPAGLSA